MWLAQGVCTEAVSMEKLQTNFQPKKVQELRVRECFSNLL